MRKWKMVPVEPTDEMFMAGRRVSGDLDTWDAYLAAAPKWEPSEEDCRRALGAMTAHRDEPPTPIEMMRAAILAAFGGAE